MLSGFLILAGFAALYFGAEWLVKGSTAMALRLGLPPLIIGLTVVAYGTGSPELVVSTVASLQGYGDLAVGNIVGSNILNLALILGLTALIIPLRIDSRLLKFDTPVMIAAGLLFFWFFRDQRIDRMEAAVMLGLIVVYTWLNLRVARRIPGSSGKAELAGEVAAIAEGPPIGPFRAGFLMVAGLIVLVAGSRCFVVGASDVARLWGVSDALIGLTIVSIGTSLPELASALIAAFRKQADLAVGNIVGSCTFNILGIAGVAGLCRPLEAPGISHIDFEVMLALSAVTLILAWTGAILRRWEGALLLGGYGGYVAWLWPA